MIRMLSPEVTDHYRCPRSVGTLSTSMAGVGHGSGGSVDSGRYVQVALQVVDGVILEARFQAFGCPSTIACGSALTEWVRGKSVGDAARITGLALADRLSLAAEKLDCALAAEDALKAALAAVGE